MCMVCDTKFKNPNRDALIKHTNSKKHNMNMTAKQNQCTISTSFKKSQDSQSMEEKAAKAELLLVAFMAEHYTKLSKLHFQIVQ